MNDNIHSLSDKAFETQAIHTKIEPSQFRELSSSLYLSSAHGFENLEQGKNLFEGTEDGFVYARWDSPNVAEFIAKLCALEGYETGIATASGMSAVLFSLLPYLSAGDHLVYCKAVFGATPYVIQHFFSRWGIEATAVDPQADQAEWEKAFTKKTRLVFFETPTNPGLDILDIKLITDIAHAHDALVVVDNCFASPFLQTPSLYGVDMVVHSATKYIDGQGRVLGGALLGNSETIKPARSFSRATGPVLSPFNAWILSASLETLSIRMEKHSSNALRLARFLHDHPKIESGRYPHLTTHPQYELANKQMRLGGGILTCTVRGGYEGLCRFTQALNHSAMAANLGMSRTILTHPASTTHSSISAEERDELGISDSLIRISVGLENIDDLLFEFAAALEVV